MTKFTAAYLYFVLLIALLFALWRMPRRRLIASVAVACACCLRVLNAGFLFDRSFTPLAKYEFRSTSFQALQKVRGLRSLPLPLPYPYLQGFGTIGATIRLFTSVLAAAQRDVRRLVAYAAVATYYPRKRLHDWQRAAESEWFNSACLVATLG